MIANSTDDCDLEQPNTMRIELPFLASKAALELDNLFLGKTFELHAIRILADKFEYLT